MGGCFPQATEQAEGTAVTTHSWAQWLQGSIPHSGIQVLLLSSISILWRARYQLHPTINCVASARTLVTTSTPFATRKDVSGEVKGRDISPLLCAEINAGL